jgi:hypothetical protein
MYVIGAKSILGSSLAALLFVSQIVGAAGVDPALQGKVSAKIEEIQTWAADPTIVSAVKQYNAAKPAQAAAMEQATWAGTSVLDPLVRGMTKSPAAEVLRSKKGDVVSEAFLSGADGGKVAFLGKTSNWSHKGNSKHDLPMSGRTWQGEVEVDESSGLQQVQVAVPVLDGRKPIGTLVVGLNIGKLARSSQPAISKHPR